MVHLFGPPCSAVIDDALGSVPIFDKNRKGRYATPSIPNIKNYRVLWISVRLYHAFVIASLLTVSSVWTHLSL
jgi:hypothetical protein